jgi:hypothetical protein
MKVICDHLDLCLSFKSSITCLHEIYHESEEGCDVDCTCGFLLERKREDCVVKCVSITEVRRKKLMRLGKRN